MYKCNKCKDLGFILQEAPIQGTVRSERIQRFCDCETGLNLYAKANREFIFMHTPVVEDKIEEYQPVWRDIFWVESAKSYIEIAVHKNNYDFCIYIHNDYDNYCDNSCDYVLSPNQVKQLQVALTDWLEEIGENEMVKDNRNEPK